MGVSRRSMTISSWWTFRTPVPGLFDAFTEVAERAGHQPGGLLRRAFAGRALAVQDHDVVEVLARRGGRRAGG
jgi:hypothetical protein